MAHAEALEQAQNGPALGRPAEAHAVQTRVAERGAPVADAKLVNAYLLGDGVAVDQAKALEIARTLLKSAPEVGAAAVLEVCILANVATPADCKGAEVVLRSEADAGNAQADLKLVALYARGVPGVPKDMQIAGVWLQKAASAGLPLAEISLSTAYMTGTFGFSQNYEQAIEWLRRAADQKYPAAQSVLAADYENGLVVKKDVGRAISYYEAAAAEGDMGSMIAMARLYERGRDVPKDAALAFKWSLQAAQAGDPDSQSKVAAAYALGAGTLADPVRAYAWFAIAIETRRDLGTEGFDDLVLARDGAGAHLSVEQKRQAVALINAQVAHQRAAATG